MNRLNSPCFVRLGMPGFILLGILILLPPRTFSQETIKGGELNSKAINLPQPIAPADAKAKGTVVVDVIISSNGKVEVAKAASGPKELFETAVEAAKKAKFAPTLSKGVPVKVEGVLKFTFK